MARRKKAASCPSQAPPNTPKEQERGRGRRQPLVLSRPAPSRGARCAEVAGGTAADCAAVCCCCPCGLAGLLVLAVVTVPAGLCRRALLRPKKKPGAAAMKRRCGGGGAAAGDAGATCVGLLEPRVSAATDDSGGDDVAVFGVGGWPGGKSPSAEVSEMEEEMWAQFNGGGFWRSPSQREMLTATGGDGTPGPHHEQRNAGIGG